MAEASVNVVVEQLICATSEWLKHEISVIHDVEEELENMSMKMQTIESVLEDAENRSMQDSTIKLWLEKLQDISYDMEDVFDEWNTRVLMQKDKEITSSSSFNNFSCLSFNHFHCFKDSSFKQLGWRRDIALRIKDINGRMNFIFLEMERFSLVSKVVQNHGQNETFYDVNHRYRGTTSQVIESEVHGPDDVKNVLLRKVLSEGREEVKRLKVISIVGVGGLGKTTLAQLVYHDERVEAEFDIRVWVWLSDSFDEVKVTEDILICLGLGYKIRDPLQNRYESIKQSLANQQFLIVLDGVCDEEFEKWNRLRSCLQGGFCGSIVLLTTRSELVATGMGTMPTNMIKPDLISDSDCWSIMSEIAFHGRNMDDSEKVEGVGQEIARKCKGLPLAARTLGGLLLTKSTEKEWIKVLESEIWELEKVELDLFPNLLLSYRELPPNVRRCFLYLALFPKDYFVGKYRLIPLWMAHGYLKPKRIQDDMMQTGLTYYRCLESQSLFEGIILGWNLKRGCPMHDIIHEFVSHLAGDEFLSVEQDNDKCTILDLTPTKRSYPKSTKVRHLFYRGSISPIGICDARKLRSCLITGLPQNVTVDLV